MDVCRHAHTFCLNCWGHTITSTDWTPTPDTGRGATWTGLTSASRVLWLYPCSPTPLHSGTSGQNSDRRQGWQEKGIGDVCQRASATERIVSLTIGHCLQCQSKLSPWKRQTKVRSGPVLRHTNSHGSGFCLADASCRGLMRIGFEFSLNRRKTVSKNLLH